MSKRRYYNFDSFRVDPTERVLLRDSKPVSLSPKVFDTLLALVQHSGHIVSKDELVEIVWPDTFVEENNLTQYVAAARRALGDNRQEQRYIETIPKRGYRFASSVRLITEDSDSVLIEEPKFALAYVGLADCYAFDWPNWKLAEEKANKALEIDPQLGEAHATIGFVRTFWQWDFAEAERQFRLAFELSPNYATAHQWYAAYFIALGRVADAKHEMQRALEL